MFSLFVFLFSLHLNVIHVCVFVQSSFECHLPVSLFGLCLNVLFACLLFSLSLDVLFACVFCSVFV